MRRTAHELRDLVGRMAAALEDTDHEDTAARAVVLATHLADELDTVHAALDRIVMAKLGEEPPGQVVNLAGVGRARRGA